MTVQVVLCGCDFDQTGTLFHGDPLSVVFGEAPIQRAGIIEHLLFIIMKSRGWV